MTEDGKTRCRWVTDDPLYIDYHDKEWGVPQHDDRALFEFLVLESAQAGLSWLTILRKREGYRRAFAGFDPKRVARFDEAKMAALLQDASIVRHPRKIASAVQNAQAFLRVQKEFGSFDRYLWQFAGGEKARRRHQDVPATTAASDRLSADLKQRGFIFVGSTVMYAYMQACGLVNDHVTTCFRYRELTKR